MNRTGRVLVALCGGLTVTGALGQDDTAPDLDFLEYLGSWDSTDEEWLAVVEWDGGEEDHRRATDESADEKFDEDQ